VTGQEHSTDRRFHAPDLVEVSGGRVASGDADRWFPGISTDSRTIAEGELFVALRGENFNGRDYAAAAFEAGAGGCLVEKGAAIEAPAGCPVIEVDDTLRGLGEIARWWRSRHEVRVAAVTGSAGKTTTKDLAAAMLGAKLGEDVLFTRGNLNNLIGLPLTLLGLEERHSHAVVELGMNHPGEIRRLAQICDPQIGVITNVHPVHLEFMGSVEAVARAKGELFEGFGEKHTAVLNADDARVMALARDRAFRSLTFGVENDAQVRAVSVRPAQAGGVDLEMDLDGRAVRLRFALQGIHNVYNLLAACGVAVLAGVGPEEIAAAAESFAPQRMRGRIVRLAGGARAIDDTYNANPRSMELALRTLSELRGDRAQAVAVLGDMFELGDHAAEAHREVGAAAAREGVDLLVLLGEHAEQAARGALEGGMASESVRIASDHEQAVRWLREQLGEGDLVLVKGSRGMRMERVLQALEIAEA